MADDYSSTNMPWPRQIDPTGKWALTPVQMNPPLPPHLQGRGLSGAPLPPTGNPNLAPTQTMPANTGGNPIINFLSSLFGAGGQSPAQGMTGLLARGRGAPGTDTLGNPLGRF